MKYGLEFQVGRTKGWKGTFYTTPQSRTNRRKNFDQKTIAGPFLAASSSCSPVERFCGQNMVVIARPWGNIGQEERMWFPKLILLISLFGRFEAFAGPKNYAGVIHRHVVEVKEAFPEPTTTTGTVAEETMVARDLKITLRTL